MSFKVASYSFTIAHGKGQNLLVICAHWKGNASVFLYFMTSTWAQKGKTDSEFSRVSGEIL